MVRVSYRVGLDEAEVQFKMVLRSLVIALIYTAKSSPEARGKVKKAFDYLQCRVPYLCERRNVRNLVEDHKIVAYVVSYYNEQRDHLKTEEVPLYSNT